MRSTKPPARVKKTKPPSARRATAGRTSLTPALATAKLPAELGVESRIARCEGAVAIARQDVAMLMNELAAARAEIAALRGELTDIVLRMRRLPPPLPGEHEEVISVDEREVLLESIRPPASRPPASTGRKGSS